MYLTTGDGVKVTNSSFNEITIVIEVDDLNYIEKQNLLDMIADGVLDDDEMVWLLRLKYPLIVDKAIEEGWIQMPLITPEEDVFWSEQLWKIPVALGFLGLLVVALILIFT